MAYFPNEASGAYIPNGVLGPCNVYMYYEVLGLDLPNEVSEAIVSNYVLKAISIMRSCA